MVQECVPGSPGLSSSAWQIINQNLGDTLYLVYPIG